jgi:hypothetical protein
VGREGPQNLKAQFFDEEEALLHPAEVSGSGIYFLSCSELRMDLSNLIYSKKPEAQTLKNLLESSQPA